MARKHFGTGIMDYQVESPRQCLIKVVMVLLSFIFYGDLS